MAIPKPATTRIIPARKTVRKRDGLLINCTFSKNCAKEMLFSGL
jgi:hypothetical protein